MASANELTTLAARGEDGRACGVDVEVQAMMLAELLVVGLSAEPFSHYGPLIESLSTLPTLVLGYANGCFGYLPTAADFAGERELAGTR